jgi:hypothetical protein
MANTLQAGEEVTSFNPLFFWQPKGGKYPDTDREPYDESAWTDQGWIQIKDTVNGASVTKRNPKTPVTGDRLGRVKNIPSGDDGVAIAVQLLYPRMDLLTIVSSMSSAMQAAATEIDTLVVSSGATAAGDASVVLDGMNTPVPLLASDSTPQAVAAKIRSTSFAGWTTGGSDAVVTFTAITPGRKGAASFSGGASGASGTMQKTTPGLSAKTGRFVSKKARTEFMLGFEGVAEAGGLFPEDTHIMGIAAACENTANAEWVWRETGADALLRPNNTLECLPAPILDSQLEGSGLSRAILDPSGKFTYVEKVIV